VSAHLIGSDGLAARNSQLYAQDKLYYVERYQKIFATGMKKRWKHRVYIDLLAGPGLCRVEATDDEFPGSPVRSLEAEFTKRIFVESDPVLADALRRRVPIDCVLIQADCNLPETIDKIRSGIPEHDALSLAFVDNLGLDVPLGTLKRLTIERAVDLLIVFQVQDLTRNIDDVLTGRDSSSRVDAFFGGRTWVEIAERARRQNALPSEVTNGLLEHYRLCLGTFGYGHSHVCQQAMKNSRNAEQYRLLLAGRNAKAVEFFKKIEQIDPSGQRGLAF
jgi:three-Cys-motif partner protein